MDERSNDVWQGTKRLDLARGTDDAVSDDVSGRVRLEGREGRCDEVCETISPAVPVFRSDAITLGVRAKKRVAD